LCSYEHRRRFTEEFLRDGEIDFRAKKIVFALKKSSLCQRQLDKNKNNRQRDKEDWFFRKDNLLCRFADVFEPETIFFCQKQSSLHHCRLFFHKDNLLREKSVVFVSLPIVLPQSRFFWGQAKLRQSQAGCFWSSQPARIIINYFGKLPIRFNGSSTTKSYLCFKFPVKIILLSHGLLKSPGILQPFDLVTALKSKHIGPLAMKAKNISKAEIARRLKTVAPRLLVSSIPKLRHSYQYNAVSVGTRLVAKLEALSRSA
jgi:hypothetical protein